MNRIKTEKSDEDIKEMETKIIKENRQKNSTAKVPTQVNRNVKMLSFQKITKKPSAVPIITKVPNSFFESAMDAESFRGRFGWTNIGCVHIPYIFRGMEKYCCVRMLEMKVLQKYMSSLDKAIYTCIHIPSFYVTEAERRLLNEINFVHCNSQFGRESFTLNDLIVRLNDAVEFYTFLEFCFMKLVKGNQSTLQKCGFIKINKENVVPYVTKNDKKYMPLFYFEGDLGALNNLGTVVTGWDLPYLKFCCKIQGIQETLYATDSFIVIDFDHIKNCFPEGTLFEDHWPNQSITVNQLLVNGKSDNESGQWTHQASRSPHNITNKPVTPKTPVQNKFKNPQNCTITVSSKSPSSTKDPQIIHSRNHLHQILAPNNVFQTNLICPAMNISLNNLQSLLSNPFLTSPHTITKKP